MELLEKKEICIKDIILELTELPASEKSEHKLFFEEHLRDLWQYTQFGEYKPLFSRLNDYWNYLSPQLLYHLMRTYFIGMKELELYDVQLFYFRNQTLLTLFCQVDKEYKEPPKGFSTIVLKFKTDHIAGDPTLEHVEEFRRKYASHYRLRDFALMLVAKGEIGSFIITFMVPISLTERLQNNIPVETLEEFGVTQVAISGICFYSRNTMMAASVVEIDEFISDTETASHSTLDYPLQPLSESHAVSGKPLRFLLYLLTFV